MNGVDIRSFEAQFGRQAARTAQSSLSGVTAALWRGDAGCGRDEIALGETPVHVVGVALRDYFCEPFSDGRRLSTGTWRRGRSQIMMAGVKPRAVLGGRWEMLHVYVPHETFASALESGDAGLELRDPLGAPDPVLTSLGHAFARELEAPGVCSPLQADALALRLIVHLVRCWSNRGDRIGPTRAGLAPWQLKRACEAMDARLGEEVGLEMLASIAGCSATHFSRAFKQSTGVPPFKWLLERRIERAREMLADQRLSLAEVALAVGFSAQPQFTTAFKRATGVTPGAWRRERLS